MNRHCEVTRSVIRSNLRSAANYIIVDMGNAVCDNCPMYRGLRIASVIPCHNESRRIGNVVARVRAVGIVDRILVIDDGSTDDSSGIAESNGAEVIRVPKRSGVGAAIRLGLMTALDECDVIVVLAGNDKDEPAEISRLLDPIARNEADFVQGSRFLGRFDGGVPLYRRIATRVHPLIFSIVARKRVTESTNGFRAFRSSLLRDPRIDLQQSWLDRYELEPYLLFKTVTLGFKVCEVPVTKTYPPRGNSYTKMLPIVGWWSILRPLLLLGLGWKR